MIKRPALMRMRWGALAFAVVTVAAVVGYRLFGRDWIDAWYMFVITVGTIGFGERSELGNAEKLFTIGVIIFGISAASYFLGGFFQMMVEGEINKAFKENRISRGIERTENHVIVCGYGRMGKILAHELHEAQQPLVVIDSDPQAMAEAQTMGFLAMAGDATEEETLLAAGIQRAKCLVTTLPNDAANVFISLTSRNLHGSLQIIARGEQQSSQKKLLQAGANRVVLPAAIGARRIAAMITHPSMVEFMELVAGRSMLDVEIMELTVGETSAVVGKTVVEIEARRKHRLLVVAIKHPVGQMVFNPDNDERFAVGDALVVMGRMTDIQNFRQESGL